MRTNRGLKVLLGSLLALLVVGAPSAEPAARKLEGTVDQLLDLDARPFAIGHRGFGETPGGDSSRPIENTIPAVRAGFRAGLSVVEVDVQLTRDGEVAVFHEDFLPDFTCLNRLTLSQLQRRLPHVPSLPAVLRTARKFNQSVGPLRGLVIVELKAASPLCDPQDRRERALVSAVARVIRRMEMTEQVMLTSFSPALLSIAATKAPDVTRLLALSGLQFLTAAEIEALLGLPVTLIDKRRDLGLQWAEIGPIFRLPGYRSVEEVLATAVAVGARVIEADLALLGMGGSPFVDTMHGFGLKVFGYTANGVDEWWFMESLGVDAIYTNDIPLGVELQAPIP